MIFCSNNVSDLKRYFQNSFVKFPMAGEIVHYVDKVQSDGVRGRFYGPDDKGNMVEQEFLFELHHDDGLQPDVQFIMPRKSYFNHEGKAHLLKRIPARQYHRGVTSENTSIVNLHTNGDFLGVNLKFAVLHAYVGKQAFPPIRRLDGGSVAISPRLAYAAAGNLYVDQIRIGSINHDDKVIHLSNELFLPEVSVVAGEYTVSTPKETKKPTKKVNPKGYTPKKVKAEEFNEEVEF